MATATAILSNDNLDFKNSHGTSLCKLTASSTELTLSSQLNVNSKKITNLATPTADHHAATKGYVDGLAEGLDIKHSCAVATTANIALTSVTSVDGETLADGDRVLVKDQTTGSENGIYVFTLTTSALTRAADMAPDSSAAGSFTFIEKGTNADKGFVCTTDSTQATGGASDTVGTHDLIFTQFSGAGSITAAQDGGLEMNGTAISIKSDGVTNMMIADSAVNSDQIAANAVTAAKLDLTGSGDITFGSTNGNQVLHIASHDGVDGGLKLAGTFVTASATELNFLRWRWCNQYRHNLIA